LDTANSIGYLVPVCSACSHLVTQLQGTKKKGNVQAVAIVTALSLSRKVYQYWMDEQLSSAIHV